MANETSNGESKLGSGWRRCNTGGHLPEKTDNDTQTYYSKENSKT